MSYCTNIKKIGLLIALCMGMTPALQATTPTVPVHSFPCLSEYTRNQKFEEVQKAFEVRCNLFHKGRHFHHWEPNKPKKDILEEFAELNEWRFNSWYEDPKTATLVARADFTPAQDLLEKGYYRLPYLVAFQYNQTDGTYNSSCIHLNNQRFLALEGPSEKTLKNFYRLLQNFQVTELVRLTPEKEQQKEKSYPYWRNNTIVDSANQKITLNIQRDHNSTPYPIQYFALDTWLDDQGISPRELLDLVLKVQKSANPKGLIAVHCAGGVGRTGTFISAYLLIQEIDRQIAAGINPNALQVGIEKMVMQLSLQRPYMVAVPEQYVTLYRTVDIYIEQLKSKK